ncbi:UNVERIFIED_ORG: hypothetical protein LHK14_03025 [Roseateles sp. XES5]|uniref:hypothetical protein n=1 Tax=Shinella sp. G-2 TaxID=3133141 RepID=UPI001D004E81|nr:hypothetical protein [Roseateles sp. XES5]
MPHRTKDEAQLRMAIGVTKVSRLQGQSAAEGLQALKEHLANVRALECSQSSPDAAESEPVEPLRQIE